MEDDFTPVEEGQFAAESNWSDETTSADSRKPVGFDGELVGPTPTGGFSLSALWQTLRIMLFPTRAERSAYLTRRIESLSRAVAEYPDAPTNYVLRGELYLEFGDFTLAEADFRQALELAAKQVESEDWGVIAQVVQDRAQTGLAEALRNQL
jgi:tetratricopeptide (TPR) repeat protein